MSDVFTDGDFFFPTNFDAFRRDIAEESSSCGPATGAGRAGGKAN
jgi:hypothetical protein